uniref:Uncharacterized protein n=1 Tax=Candidatus Methanogaster sp. ANME-2c ERB4 TaxID=2759911 RepID=A0A7G9YKC9_9EURY|nr:hypothetical protein DBMLIPLO_00015 [Methanosarcinales archaeon ANME-2c ERB4]
MGVVGGKYGYHWIFRQCLPKAVQETTTRVRSRNTMNEKRIARYVSKIQLIEERMEDIR